MQALLLALCSSVGAFAQSPYGSSSPSLPSSSTPTGTATMPTTTMYGLDEYYNNYNGSIVSADQTSTTMELLCNPGPPRSLGNGYRICSSQPPYTITYGPSEWHYYLSNTGRASTGGDERTLIDSAQCDLVSSTSLSCTGSLSRNYVDTPHFNFTTTDYSSIYTSDLPINGVTITAGVEKLSVVSTTTSGSPGSGPTSVPAGPTNATSQSAAHAQRASVISALAERSSAAAFLGVVATSALFAVLL